MSMWFKNFVVDQIVCECSLEFELMKFDIEMLIMNMNVTRTLSIWWNDWMINLSFPVGCSRYD